MIGNTRVLVVDDQQAIHDDFTEILLSPPRGAEQDDDLSSAFLEEHQMDRSFLPEFELLHARNGEDACARVAADNERGRPSPWLSLTFACPRGSMGWRRCGGSGSSTATSRS